MLNDQLLEGCSLNTDLCQSLKENFPQFTETNLYIIFKPKQTNTSSEVVVSMLLSELWPGLMRLTQLMLDRSTVSLKLYFSLSLLHSTHFECTLMQKHTFTTQTCKHTFIWPLPSTFTSPLGCRGYLHHKQLQDAGGPLRWKCWSLGNDVLLTSPHISKSVSPGTGEALGTSFFYLHGCCWLVSWL